MHPHVIHAFKILFDWEGWRGANDDMARLHDRMPVILEEVAEPVWLGE